MGFYIADPPPRLTTLRDTGGTYIPGAGFVGVQQSQPVTRTETLEDQAEMLTRMKLARAERVLAPRPLAPGRSKAERAKILARFGPDERAEKYARRRQRRAAW